MNGRGMNLFKPRTSFGKWLDSIGRNQEWIVEITGFSRNTVSAICNDPTRTVQRTKQLKLIGALRKHGYDVSVCDFW